MSRHSRRYKPPPQDYGSASLPGCDRVWMPRVHVLLLCLFGVLVLAMVLGVFLSNDYIDGNFANRFSETDWTKDRLSHKPSKCSTAQIRHLASQVDGNRLWKTHLRPILIERLPGTPGSLVVQQHIASTLSSLLAGWSIDLDSFQSPTPHGQDLFVLLDLLGAPHPIIVNHFDNTLRWFDRLITAEKRLHRQGLLASHTSEQAYFRKDMYLGPVQDDHIPFLLRGVPVLHVIATPFPQFWHTLDDTEENMHRPTVENLTKILAVFLAEYLGLY